jgi:hypothetical protein
MRGLPFYLDVMNAAERGAAMRAAERRAMYARPDAEPLPEEAETSKTRRWPTVPGALRQGMLVVSRLVGRARVADSDPA